MNKCVVQVVNLNQREIRKVFLVKEKVMRKKILKAIVSVLFLMPLFFEMSSTAEAEIYSTISGYALEEGTNQPIAGLAVRAVKMDGSEVIVVEGVTNEKGQYVLRGVIGGTYSVTLQNLRVYYPAKKFVQVTVVSGKNIVNHNFSVKEGASVSGRVLKGDRTTPYKGVRVGGAVLIGTDLFEKYGETDENGFYKINGMFEADDASVAAEVPGAVYEYVHGIKLISGEETKNVDIVVVKDASNLSIKGRVVSETSGEGIENVSVYINNVGLALRLMIDTYTVRVDTDANGYFEVYGLPPGKYVFSLLSIGHKSFRADGVELKEGALPLEIEFKLTPVNFDTSMRYAPDSSSLLPVQVWNLNQDSSVKPVMNKCVVQVVNLNQRGAKGKRVLDG